MGDLPSQHNQEVMVAELKQKLEAWREVIIPFRSILLWKNPWHTVILLSSVSVMFLMIWWCDLSVVSLFSIAGAVITLADYVGPIAIKTLSDPSNWNTKKEKLFDDICWSLVIVRLRCSNMIYWIYDLKAYQPLLYYTGTLTTLIALAFFGQIVNNLLLTYFLDFHGSGLKDSAFSGFTELLSALNNNVVKPENAESFKVCFVLIFSLLMPGFWQNDPVKGCFAVIGSLIGKCSGKSPTDKKGKTKGN